MKDSVGYSTNLSLEMLAHYNNLVLPNLTTDLIFTSVCFNRMGLISENDSAVVNVYNRNK